ncbi:LysR family transcriptional regulator [Oceanobacillus salinisoli]|uniref:LysR family transcriptional regulator n=1 Tax=Oceanobacillus salinisoli TaxID=2678611 RepID=UPI0012E0D978|nr:LysR family transcriptional regulator [Oceanobacillus salinisoli]
MELRHLHYFIAVAEHLNFTHAARSLYVDQSSVSQQISKLEEEIGVKLFYRSKRTVQLTNAGQVFYDEAMSILEKSRQAVDKAKKADAGTIGKLKIGFLIAPVREFLPEVIRNFKVKYPNVEIELNHLPIAYLNDPNKSDDLDIVFTIITGIKNLSDLNCHILSSDSTCVYVHQQHPLAEKSSVTLPELSNESFIMRHWEESPQWYDYTLSICRESNFTPKIVSQTKRIETVFLFIDSGIGISILPNYLKMYATSSIRLVELEGEAYKTDILVYHQKKNKNPAIPLFLEELERVLAERGDRHAGSRGST